MMVSMLTDLCVCVCDRQTNRPYSMLNVFENMHRAIAKPSLTKVLDDLCDR